MKIELEDENTALANCVTRMVRRPPVMRDRARVLVEYDGDKYGGFVSQDPQSFDEVLAIEANNTSRQPEVLEWITRGDTFVASPAGVNDGLQTALVLDTLRAWPAGRYCELGCGFGRFLQAGKVAIPGADFYGGDFSPNGVSLARRFGLDAVPFDFTEMAAYEMIRPETTVFTVQAIEQLRSAECVLAGLRRVRNNVTRVIHIEPGPHPERTGLIGHLRDAYTHWNGYNRDLVGLLQHTPDVRILEQRYDVHGINPLNSVHVIVWEFVNGLVY